MRRYVYDRDRGLCHYCRPPRHVSYDMCNIDHIDPWPFGETDPDNLVVACPNCNRTKGMARLPAEGHRDDVSRNKALSLDIEPLSINARLFHPNNRYPGTCEDCGIRVTAGEGYSEPSAGSNEERFLLRCTSCFVSNSELRRRAQEPT